MTTLTPVAAIFEFLVVGAGPAALCAIARLIASEADPKRIAWVDPQFGVGAFGTSLSAGSSVPGNTDVTSYMRVIKGIADTIPSCRIPEEVWEGFVIAPLERIASDKTCPIQVAAEPFRYISDRLASHVTQIRDTVASIDGPSSADNGRLYSAVLTGSGETLRSRRVVLVTGSEPRTLPLEGLTSVDPNTAFIRSELEALVAKEKEKSSGDNNESRPLRFAVVGSSHSAALAVMNIVRAGVPVVQFMNKPYKFASKQIAADGTPYTQYDNTGLKGDVAAFTREMLNQKEQAVGPDSHACEVGAASLLWTCRIGNGVIEPSQIADCTHSVVCIGYRHSSTLAINKHPLSSYSHDPSTSAILPLNNNGGQDDGSTSGLFGIGIAFPKRVVSPSGEEEFAVGVGKFWSTVDDRLVEFWKKSTPQV